MSEIHVGFTGTRRGMTEQQRTVVSGALALLGDVKLVAHHGACLGADEDFHKLVREQIPTARIVAHPPENEKLMCRDSVEDADEVREAKDYKARDRDIVNESMLLIGTPGEDDESRNPCSGTWYTIRYARKIPRDRVVVGPAGFVIEGDEK